MTLIDLKFIKLEWRHTHKALRTLYYRLSILAFATAIFIAFDFALANAQYSTIIQFGR
jgi:hypothetical protein